LRFAESVAAKGLEAEQAPCAKDAANNGRESPGLGYEVGGELPSQERTE
jgi:hypothetical protein